MKNTKNEKKIKQTFLMSFPCAQRLKKKRIIYSFIKQQRKYESSKRQNLIWHKTTTTTKLK